ncbi:hypothetical protein [Ammoniphilus sp. 3BR4]|uniref:hypothetical protein n=1 Tax=Ammoniphilus sp. 3BR4 TaxID=3158265 RepID=UPI003466D988
MYPETVKLCKKENFCLLTVDQSAINQENHELLVKSFLASQHKQGERTVSNILEVLHESNEWSEVEICSCSSHTCALLKGSQCISRALDKRFWSQLDSEVTSVDQDHIYIKLGM